MMEMISIIKKGYRCKRCDYEWIPKNKNSKPRVCPKCKSAWWDVPKKK